LLIAATLALAPFHTGIVNANVALVAVELGVLAVWTARERHEITTAILVAVSAGLKPQIGLCFLLYYVVRRRWRISGITLAALGVVAAVGLLRLEVGHTPWLENYLNDNHVLLESGILANFTPLNPMRFGLINLQVVAYSLVGSVRWANDVAILVGIVLVVVWLLGMRRRGDQGVARLKRDHRGEPAAGLSPILRRDSAGLSFVLGVRLLPEGANGWNSLAAVDASILDSRGNVAGNDASGGTHSLGPGESLVVGSDRDAA
jgi:hypothetical protein